MLIKKIVSAISLIIVFSSSWAQQTSIQSSVVAIQNITYPTVQPGSLSCWYSNAISSCAALAKYTGTFTSLLTYSADANRVGMRFYMNVTTAVGNGGCYNTADGTTLAIIGYNPNPALTPGTMAFQQQQDWRNMALMAKASGQSVTIYTDGNCNVLDMQLD
jgi:hypothetical protein